FCRGSMTFAGHPERDEQWGIHNTSGSLGHGAPMSVGVAYAKRLSKEPGTVYCLLGDQELNEGSVWEAVLLAARFRLTNLVWLVAATQSADASLPMDSIPAKFLAFNWDVDTCSGHSPINIAHVLYHRTNKKPLMVQCHTIKGFGSPAMERDPRAWHHRSPTEAE